MRLSRYFLPILKETPREAEIVAGRLVATLKASNAARFEEAGHRNAVEKLLRWPD